MISLAERSRTKLADGADTDGPDWQAIQDPSDVPTTSMGCARRSISTRVALRLRGHLRARARVFAGREGEVCQKGAPVNVQRRVRGRWRVIRHLVTSGEGTVFARLPDRVGRYRARLGARSVEGDAGETVCEASISSVVIHRH